MKIGNFDTDERVLVVAEIGNNHEGDFGVARELTQAAAMCGVAAVKFQTFRTEYYVSKSDEKRFARLKSFELTLGQFRELRELACSLGLLFISTPLDLDSVAGLEGMVDAYKIASGDNTFYPLVSQVARTGKPMIISTGISDGKQVKHAVDFVRCQWNKVGITDGQLALLHCVSSYPVAPEQANLRSIPYLVKNFPGVTVGYSDHTQGITAALAAVALGARIVEKHFTLDKNYSDFRDHQLSADPEEMKELVAKIAAEEQMLGVYSKTLQPGEQDMVKAIRRSIVAGRDMPAGHIIAKGDLTWVRPAGGLAPGEEDKLVGRRLKQSVAFGEKILADDVEDEVSSKATSCTVARGARHNVP